MSELSVFAKHKAPPPPFLSSPAQSHALQKDVDAAATAYMFTAGIFQLVWGLPVAFLPAAPQRDSGAVVVTPVEVPQNQVPPVYKDTFGVSSGEELLAHIVKIFEHVSGDSPWARDGLCAAALRWAGRIPGDMVSKEPALAYYGGAVHGTGAEGLFSCGDSNYYFLLTHYCIRSRIWRRCSR